MAAKAAGVPWVTMTANVMDEVCCERRKKIVSVLCPAIFDDNVLPLNIPVVAKPKPQAFDLRR